MKMLVYAACRRKGPSPRLIRAPYLGRLAARQCSGAHERAAVRRAGAARNTTHGLALLRAGGLFGLPPDTVRNAFALLPSLQERGFPIDKQTVNILLSGCARLGDLITALRLWDTYFAP